MSFGSEEDAIPGGCHMCLAIPGKIVDIIPDARSLALVEVAGVRRRVDLGLLEADKPEKGDWVLIHVGFAMSKISEQDAIEQMNTLAMLGEAEAALQEIRGYGLGEEDNDQPAS
jgi:hydrogenase expression/formation protein HypC